MIATRVLIMSLEQDNVMGCESSNDSLVEAGCNQNNSTVNNENFVIHDDDTNAGSALSEDAFISASY